MTAVAKLPLPPLPDAELLTTLGRDAYTDQQMRDYARAAIAALSPAELGGVEAGEDRVEVALHAYGRAVYKWTRQDKDDRDEPCTVFAMRAVVAALSTPRAAEAVSEEMVERGVLAYMEQEDLCLSRSVVRAILTAALTPPSAKGE